MDANFLQEEMERFNGMGNPVESFLTSDEFLSVAPDEPGEQV